MAYICALEQGLTSKRMCLNGKTGDGETAPSPLLTLEHALHPYVAFLILPVFAFANAGVSLAGFGPSALMQPLPLGIAAGLFFGKQIGVLAGSLASGLLGYLLIRFASGREADA